MAEENDVVERMFCPSCHRFRTSFRCVSCNQKLLGPKWNIQKRFTLDVLVPLEQRMERAGKQVVLHENQQQTLARHDRVKKVLKERIESTKRQTNILRKRKELYYKQNEATKKVQEDVYGIQVTGSAAASSVSSSTSLVGMEDRINVLTPLVGSLMLNLKPLALDIGVAQRTVLADLLSFIALNPISENEIQIVNIQLPNNADMYSDLRPEEVLGSALGYSVLLINLFVKYTGAFLPYPMFFRGSKSVIVHRSESSTDFLLYYSTDAEKMQTGLSLFCLNVISLCDQFGVVIPPGKEKEPLVNFLRVIQSSELSHPHNWHQIKHLIDDNSEGESSMKQEHNSTLDAEKEVSALNEVSMEVQRTYSADSSDSDYHSIEGNGGKGATEDWDVVSGEEVDDELNDLLASVSLSVRFPQDSNGNGSEAISAEEISK